MGETAPALLRSAVTVRGRSWTDAVFNTIKRHISSEAQPVPESWHIRCTAAIPIGVAALPNPRRLAARLPHKAFLAASSPQACGNNRRRSGRSRWDNRSFRPAASIAVQSPLQRQRGPASVIASCTPADAPSRMDADKRAVWPVNTAQTVENKKIAVQMIDRTIPPSVILLDYRIFLIQIM